VAPPARVEEEAGPRRRAVAAASLTGVGRDRRAAPVGARGHRGWAGLHPPAVEAPDHPGAEEAELATPAGARPAGLAEVEAAAARLAEVDRFRFSRA
jgi:hypothetical protein